MVRVYNKKSPSPQLSKKTNDDREEEDDDDESDCDEKSMLKQSSWKVCCRQEDQLVTFVRDAFIHETG